MKQDDLLKEALTKTDALLDNLNSLGDETIKEKNVDIINMIERYMNLTDVIEDRRNKIHDNALSLVGIIVTALTIFVMLNKWDSFMLIPVVFLATLLLTQFIIIGIYYHQNKSDYVFLDHSLKAYANKWKWFYYGNDYIKDILYEKKKDPKVTYAQGLNFLIENYRDENSKTEITNNIQQLYLLQVHNFYKNRYYLVLTKIQQIGSIISLVSAFVALIIALIIAGANPIGSC